MVDKNKILKFQKISFGIVVVLGTLFHFTYELLNNNKIVALFSAVNESTWEHLKLIFFPMLIAGIIGYVYIGKNINNYICSVGRGIVIAMSFIVVFFYTYTGIIGKNYSILNIGSFFIASVIGTYITYKNIIRRKKCNQTIYAIFLIVLMFLFFIFTFNPPQINLFKDPVTGGYGIVNK